jgi:hypothetical protein
MAVRAEGIRSLQSANEMVEASNRQSNRDDSGWPRTVRQLPRRRWFGTVRMGQMASIGAVSGSEAKTADAEG